MIRCIFLFALLIAYWNLTYGQDKNILLIGGNVGAMYTSNDITNLDANNSSYTNIGGGTYFNNSGDYVTTYINLDATVFYYVTNKLLIGTGFNILNEKNTYASDLITKSKSTSYFVSPKIRFYIYQGLFGQAQYNIGVFRQEIVSNDISLPSSSGYSSINYSTTFKGNTTGVGLSVGYSLPLGSNITIDILLSYIRNKNKNEYENKNETGDYTIKQNTALISIGFNYILKQNADD